MFKYTFFPDVKLWENKRSRSCPRRSGTGCTHGAQTPSVAQWGPSSTEQRVLSTLLCYLKHDGSLQASGSAFTEPPHTPSDTTLTNLEGESPSSRDRTVKSLGPSGSEQRDPICVGLLRQLVYLVLCILRLSPRPAQTLFPQKSIVRTAPPLSSTAPAGRWSPQFTAFFCWPLMMISRTLVRSIILLSMSMMSGCSLAPLMNSSRVSSPEDTRQKMNIVKYVMNH